MQSVFPPRTPSAFVVLVLALASAACGGSGSTQLVGPTGPKCQATVSGVPSSVPAGGGQVSLTVNAARECGWTAASESSWAQVTPASGQGPGSLTVRVSANAAASPRSGVLVVNDARIGLSQEPAPCRYVLSSSSVAVSSLGGSVGVGVQAPSGCAWTAAGGSWVEAVRAAGSGNGTAEFLVAANPGAARSLTVTVAGQPWRIDQAAASVPGTPPTPPPPPPDPDPPPPPPAPEPELITLSGRIDAVVGSCPNVRFTLVGRSVFTDQQTVFRSGNCKHLENRREVRIEGDVRQGGEVYARVVEVRQGDDD